MDDLLESLHPAQRRGGRLGSIASRRSSIAIIARSPGRRTMSRRTVSSSALETLAKCLATGHMSFPATVGRLDLSQPDASLSAIEARLDELEEEVRRA